MSFKASNAPEKLPFNVQAGQNQLLEIIQFDTLTMLKNIDIPLQNGGVCRGNVYLPKDYNNVPLTGGQEGPGRYPGLMTYGPYGKDLPYSNFHLGSYAEVPDEQKGPLSAWEVPHPDYWVAQGYVVYRIDERGIGSSPGFLDTMSDQTSSDFAECIEWAADQSWSSGKIGLLGISYYGGSQWRVAARRPKGLTCILPWEGMTDYYRDRVRHGGILSNQFVHFWWKNQVQCMQYGTETKNPRRWGPGKPVGEPVGPDCIEGVIPPETLVANHRDQTVDNREYKYLDEPYHASRVYNLSDINVPVLSVANLGGILLHLRGNVVGYLEAGTKNKWIWFISGRHDLPFYLPHYVKLQKSFLDAWLKGKDADGWLEGPNAKIPAVSLLQRKGNPGFDSNEAEATFLTRTETSWPPERTEYTKFHLDPSNLTMFKGEHALKDASELNIATLGKSDPISFKFTFDEDTEIAGHIVANLAMGINPKGKGANAKDIDVFVTLRHLDKEGKEIFYTGTAGDPVPLCKGWLRASVRAVDESSPRHKHWLPHRNYISTEVSFVKPGTPVDMLIEAWPTQVNVAKGNSIVFEIATADTQGSGIFLHQEPTDRNEDILGENNILYFGPEHANWLQLPILPPV